MLAPKDQGGQSDQPPGPGSCSSSWPADQNEKGTGQDEGGASHRCGHHAETEHPAGHVGAGPGDQDGDHHLSRKDQPHWSEVAHQRRQRGHCRLPVEGQWLAQSVEWAPQGKEPVMDLLPCLGGPRDHLGDKVPALEVVGVNREVSRQAVASESVIGPERCTVEQGWNQHGHAGHHHPCQAERVGKPRVIAMRCPHRRSDPTTIAGSYPVRLHPNVRVTIRTSESTASRSRVVCRRSATTRSPATQTSTTSARLAA